MARTTKPKVIEAVTPVRVSRRTVPPKKTAVAVTEERKSRRTTPVKQLVKTMSIKEEFPRGGHHICNVERCEYRFKFEKGGNYWVANVICVYSCRDACCPVFQTILAGSKDRIRTQLKGEP